MIAKIALYPYHKPQNRNRQRKRPINRKKWKRCDSFCINDKKRYTWCKERCQRTERMGSV